MLLKRAPVLPPDPFRFNVAPQLLSSGVPYAESLPLALPDDEPDSSPPPPPPLQHFSCPNKDSDDAPRFPASSIETVLPRGRLALLCIERRGGGGKETEVSDAGCIGGREKGGGPSARGRRTNFCRARERGEKERVTQGNASVIEECCGCVEKNSQCPPRSFWASASIFSPPPTSKRVTGNVGSRTRISI